VGLLYAHVDVHKAPLKKYKQISYKIMLNIQQKLRSENYAPTQLCAAFILNNPHLVFLSIWIWQNRDEWKF